MNSFKLLSYNIRFGGKGREEALAAVIRGCDADIIVLQEATRPDVVERLARLTAMPVRAAHPGQSLAFLSRIEIERHEWHPMLRPGRETLEIVPAGALPRIFGVHLSAIHSNWTERRRVRELRTLMELVAPYEGSFHLLTGDFNTLAPGEILDTRRLPPRLRPFVWLSGGRVRYETIGLMLDAGYVDAYRYTHPDEPGYTFPTWDPHVRLDYFFVPAQFAEHLTDCRVATDHPEAAQASDHFPLAASFTQSNPG